MRRLVLPALLLPLLLASAVVVAAPARAATPVLGLAQTALDLGDVRMGTTGAFQTSTLVNRGSTAVTLTGGYGASGPFVGGGNCKGKTLAPGATCKLTFVFRPTTTGAVTATVTATLAGVTLPVTVRGRGLGVFRVSPVGFDFGGVALGSTSPPQAVTVTNVSAAPQTLSIAGGAAGVFGGAQNCQGVTLQPGATCQITYTFTPSALGLVTGTTNGTLNGQPFHVTFKGAGLRQLSVSPTAFDFGDVALGDPSPQQAVTVTNRGTSPAPVTIAGGGAGVFGGSQNCQGVTLAPGASCQVFYQFTPTALGAATVTANGTLNGQPFSITLRGKGIPRWLISATTLDLGETPVGTSSPTQAVTVTNRGRSAAVGSIAGGAAGVFGGSQNCQGVSIAAGGSCQVFYRFTPTAAGARTAVASGSFDGQPFSIRLTGTGITGAPTRTFRISPTAFDFGSTPVGNTSPQQAVTITNVGSTPVVGSIAGGAAGAFGGSQNCQGVTLQPGQSCQVFYAFNPTAVGAVTGSSTGSFNGQPFAFSFRGTGVRQWLVSPTGFDFGDTRPGSTAQQAVTIRNVGTSPAVGSIAGGAAGAFGGSQNCQGVTIAPGGSCQVFYRFGAAEPGAATGTTNGSFVGQPFSFRFAGNGRQAWLISPTSFDFGDTALGAAAPAQSVTLRNLSDSAQVGAVAGGAAGAFGGSQNCQGVTLAPGSACQITYGFTASAPGPVTATTSGSFVGQPFAFSFAGTGRRDLLVSPVGLDLGPTAVGSTSAPLDVVVTNVSGHGVAVTATRPAAPVPFLVSTTCAGVTLEAGASCRYRFTLRPTATGAVAATYRATVSGVAVAVALGGRGA